MFSKEEVRHLSSKIRRSEPFTALLTVREVALYAYTIASGGITKFQSDNEAIDDAVKALAMVVAKDLIKQSPTKWARSILAIEMMTLGGDATVDVMEDIVSYVTNNKSIAIEVALEAMVARELGVHPKAK